MLCKSVIAIALFAAPIQAGLLQNIRGIASFGPDASIPTDSAELTGPGVISVGDLARDPDTYMILNDAYARLSWDGGQANLDATASSGSFRSGWWAGSSLSIEIAGASSLFLDTTITAGGSAFFSVELDDVVLWDSTGIVFDPIFGDFWDRKIFSQSMDPMQHHILTLEAVGSAEAFGGAVRISAMVIATPPVVPEPASLALLALGLVAAALRRSRA
jgi:hypothetical protein